MIDGKIFFDKPVKNDFRRYEAIQKISTGQGDDQVYFLGTLKGSLLKNPLAGSRVIRAGESTIKFGEGTISACQYF